MPKIHLTPTSSSINYYGEGGSGDGGIEDSGLVMSMPDPNDWYVWNKNGLEMSQGESPAGKLITIMGKKYLCLGFDYSTVDDRAYLVYGVSWKLESVGGSSVTRAYINVAIANSADNGGDLEDNQIFGQN